MFRRSTALTPDICSICTPCDNTPIWTRGYTARVCRYTWFHYNKIIMHLGPYIHFLKHWILFGSKRKNQLQQTVSKQVEIDSNNFKIGISWYVLIHVALYCRPSKLLDRLFIHTHNTSIFRHDTYHCPFFFGDLRNYLQLLELVYSKCSWCVTKLTHKFIRPRSILVQPISQSCAIITRYNACA